MIHKTEPSDTPALTWLLRGLGWFERMAKETLERTATIIARHLERCLADYSHTIYVAQDQTGAMVGYVAVHWLPYLFLPGPEGFISELFVTEAARGAGLGGLFTGGDANMPETEETL